MFGWHARYVIHVFAADVVALVTCGGYWRVKVYRRRMDISAARGCFCCVVPPVASVSNGHM